MVTITVKGGKTFMFHKNILTKNSLYFDKALNGDFAESETLSINLDDIEAENFGLYACLVYPTTVVNVPLTLRQIWIRKSTIRFSWKTLLRLWQLADRFLNRKISDMAKTELDTRFQELSVDRWLNRYQTQDGAYVKSYVSLLDEAFRICEDEGIAFDCEFVTGLSNCPPQVFAEYVEELSDNFKTAVMKEFALRHADPKVTAKKRRMEEMKKAEGSAKKQNQNG